MLALANEELPNALAAHYELQNDMAVTSTAWVPIGNAAAFSGQTDTTKGTPLSTDNMKIASSYVGWDFDNT